MQLPHGTIVAVIDGEHLELYRNSGDEAHPALDVMPAPKLDLHNKAAGTHHHTSSANPNGHLVAEDAHAAGVVDWLQTQVLAHKIDHLVVIAAPRTLGEMRLHYSKQLQGVLTQEIAKDLIGRSGSEILGSLKTQ
ncbi:host attachment protein [Emcibacter sp. SYSU 3D8]|uniref:baeRF12 domain-containing protein n=1 Tax=Emcibacter sp. SYSU 3D8 TaxID=3133969 RepID=UPI0031FF2C8D